MLVAVQVEAISDAFGQVQVQWLFDCTTHDADIRGALGAGVEGPGDESLRSILRFGAAGYRNQGVERGLPVAVLLADGEPVLDDGGDDRAVTVDAPAFELL